MKLNEINNAAIKNVITKLFPKPSTMKMCGIKRIVIDEKKNSLVFLFRSQGESKGASFKFDSQLECYTLSIYEMDEDQILIESENRTFTRLSLDDLLPTFQNETGLLI